MTKLQLHPRRDEFPTLRASIEATPAVVRKPFRPAYPGVSGDALRELRAETAPVAPTALRHAFDRNTWVPNLRTVPLVSINENLAAIRAHLDQAPALRHEDAVAEALAAIREQLAGVNAR